MMGDRDIAQTQALPEPPITRVSVLQSTATILALRGKFVKRQGACVVKE
jgi:hypothetical protein